MPAKRTKPPFPGPSPTTSGYEREQSERQGARVPLSQPIERYITSRYTSPGTPVTMEEMDAMLRQINESRVTATAAFRVQQDQLVLAKALPGRLGGEPLLRWLQRCQVAAMVAALLRATDEDPVLEITKTDTGWEVWHKGNNQRIEVTTRQEVADGA